ncbi:MAG: Single-stranded-DNA-specific exonuclease RecJ [Parcubacteria group bacterium GW2011_GWA2_44_12]|nr:MAG: Single-stranded-DNA-specific exonuclease RecJ [Parcubacteria group bacterium GW2011_GWA2_44_12]
METRWCVAEKIQDTFKEHFKEIHEDLLQLFFNRSLVAQSDIDNFLNPDYRQNLHSPFLFQDMHLLVERVKRAAEKNEKVLIYGDYDADGVCSSVALKEALKNFGVEYCDLYLPHRETEGYGLNSGTVSYIQEHNYDLLITVDCGTTNAAELSVLKSLNIDVIVCDHHVAPEEKPPCLAFINPRFKKDTYPYEHLASGGVIYKVMQALAEKKDEFAKATDLPDGFEKWALDLVAIATVADMMPLVGENRVLVRYGLVVLNKTRRTGLKALIEKAKCISGILDTYHIGFILAPRLNAAGRMDHANTAVYLLQETNYKKALEIAEELNQTNAERQAVTERIVRSAIEQIEQHKTRDKVIVVANTSEGEWPTGVVGLAAGRISQKYNRPVCVIGRSSTGVTGSGRSIPPFDITAALKQCAHLLEKFGGHPQACGFTLKSEDIVSEFRSAINKIADQQMSEDDLISVLALDMEIAFERLTWQFFDDIQTMKPFGQGNQKPRFASFHVLVIALQLVGADKQHLRLTLSQKNIQKKAIAFGFGHIASDETKFPIRAGSFIDIAFEFEVNEWNGNRELQLNIVDIKIQQ